jgi:nucleotide-binding universal stress UspA family protein
MYNRMLVPLDGSETAEVVIPYAKEIASRLGTEVILLHISSPGMKEFQPMIRTYVEHAADKIQSVAAIPQQGPPAKPLKIHGELVVGYPEDEILRYIDERAIDLLIMARHGRSGRKRWTIGSVAERVLRSTRIPALLVPAGVPGQVPFDQWPTRSLIVPLDGSELAEAVLPHAQTLAEVAAAQVVLLRACEPPSMPTYYSPELSEIPLHWGQYAQQETTRCKEVSTQYLANVEKRFRSANIGVRSEILVGKAADEIVSYTGKSPYSMIVMATHGRSGVSRLVYGSVALSILVGVANPILLIKPAK